LFDGVSTFSTLFSAVVLLGLLGWLVGKAVDLALADGLVGVHSAKEWVVRLARRAFPHESSYQYH
jgi:hypothetical protein